MFDAYGLQEQFELDMSKKNAIFPADDNMCYSFHCYVNIKIATCP